MGLGGDAPQAFVTIERAVPDDAPELLALQRLCYQREAELYHDFAIAPLTQALGGLRQDLASQVVLVAREEGEISGSVRGRLDGATCHAGRLIVHPRCERRGIGSRLMAALEAAVPEAARFELFTGHLSEGNLRLYVRLGYREFRRQAVSEKLTLVFLEKPRAS
jgi:ribosomal protein S18 acetylase RimI-like enzyme